MNSAQDRIVLLAFLLEESAWLFALFGMIGLMLAGGGSPMAWLAGLAIMSVSLLLVRIMHAIILPTIIAAAIQMVVGVLVIYATVGSQVSPTFQGVDLGWLGTLFSDELPQDFGFRAILGSFMGAILWWRGGRIGSAEFLSESLSISFKAGVLIMAIASVVDMAHPADLNIFPIMFIFFAAGIAGLSIAHLLPASSNATEERAWIRVIGGVMSIVLVLGLLFSILKGEVLSAIAAPLVVVLNAIATVIFFVIILPIALIIDFLTRLFFGFLSAVGNPQELPPPQLIGGGLAEQLQSLQDGNEQSPIAMLILQIGQWTVLGVIILIMLYILAKAYKRRSEASGAEDDAMRESVKEDADAAYDFAKLFLGMLPSRFRKQRARKFALPDDDPNVVDVFRVYFGMLTLAEEKGIPRPTDKTPGEYQSVLESIFSTRLVSMATAAFVRACYGHHPASREQIDEMRSSLEREASEVKKAMSKESGIRGKLKI